MLIHFEIKNDDFIAQALKITQRYLKAKNRMYEFENYFLKFVTKMTKMEGEIDKEELWNDLYMELVNYQDPNLKRVAFEYFDFISWAESKSQRKSFENILQKKALI